VEPYRRATKGGHRRSNDRLDLDAGHAIDIVASISKKMDASSTQAASEIWWLTKIVVPLLGILIVSAVIPLLLHHLKYKREREERLFEARKEAYKEYFKKIEGAVSDAGQEYERFSREVMPKAFLKLLQSNNSPESIVEFQQTVGDFPLRIQTAYRKSVEEITSLQLLCSETLLGMTERFEELNRKLLDKSTKWLGELKTTMLNPNVDAPIAKEMQAIGEEIRTLKQQIVRQMRQEIGSDSF
jgi:hypothetical protein